MHNGLSGPIGAQQSSFEPGPAARPGATSATPEPGRGGGEPLLDREWGLSAGQVAIVVVAIVAVCELVGALF